MTTPLTSIVLCTYDMGRFLRGALRSVFAQTSENFELLILDDGSGDDTWKILEPLRSLSHVRLFKNEQRRGLTFCRRALLEESRGELISILDADDQLLPSKVKLHASHFAKEDQCGVVWGRCTVKDLSSNTLTQIPEKGFRPGWDLVTPYSAVHSATTWRKEAVLESGGYDSEWTVVEAVDLFLKVGDRWTQSYVDVPVAIKQIRDNAFRRYLAEHGKQVSQSLLLSTLERRYGKRSGALWERLCQQKETLPPFGNGISV